MSLLNDDETTAMPCACCDPTYKPYYVVRKGLRWIVVEINGSLHLAQTHMRFWRKKNADDLANVLYWAKKSGYAQGHRVAALGFADAKGTASSEATKRAEPTAE